MTILGLVWCPKTMEEVFMVTSTTPVKLDSPSRGVGDVL
jgi:hypothetical protein